MTIPGRYLAFDEQLLAMRPGMASGAVVLGRGGYDRPAGSCRRLGAGSFEHDPSAVTDRSKTDQTRGLA